MFRRLCSKHAQVQKSCSLPCHCARPVLAPSSIYFLHKGRRRPRRGCCVRSNSICSSSNFASNLGLDGPNINFQFRLHSAGALSASFSDLRSRTAFTATVEESDHIEQNKQTTTKPQHDLLSQQLIFLFSDLNLRNNKHARSILIDDQYLPLKELLEIKSIKNITCDEESGGDPTAMVMDAIDLVNKNESNVQLHMDQFDNGELFVRRSPPFSYSESIKSSHDRMMVIEGWPLENKKSRPRWAVSHVRMLLCNENTIFDKEMRIDANNTPMTYWRYDHAMGVINIEFKSESGALGAWENLERAASSQAAADSLGIEVYRLPPEDKARKAYKLQIGDIALIARSINMTSINDDHNLETGSNKSLVDDQPNSIPYQESRVKKIGPVDVLPLTYNKVWETFGTLSLSQFTDAMNQLFQYHVTLPPSVGHDLRDNDLQQQLLSRRHDLYADVLRLVSSFKASVDQGEIRALRGKDGYELSDSLGMALQIFSETPISERPIEDVGGIVGGSMSPYEACLDVFEILSDLNLDIHPSHYTYAIRAACIESRWREAAHLFLSQVDGDDGFNPNATGGYVPIDPELAWEGLYAVACDAKMAEPAGEGVDQCPSKRVFDTAMKMSMISPPGQEKYILAAGEALGRAGLWRDCLVFASDSDSVSTYGPVIAAAAMQACIECARYTEAISAYDLFMSSSQAAASEWQWGGGNITAVKPLCRDLALLAMGSVESGGLSRDAMRMFGEAIDEGSPLSKNAIVGLAHCVEYDGDWQSSINLLKGFVESVYRKKHSSWHVISDVFGKLTGASNEEALGPFEENRLLADLLASAMRVCNQQGQHGLAILLCSIMNEAYIGEGRTTHNGKFDCTNGKAVNIIVSQAIVLEHENILEVFVQSLHGLDCGGVAEAVLDTLQDDMSISLPHGSRRSDTSHAQSWIHALVAIDRVLEAINAIRSNGAQLSPEDRLLFERGLRRAMEHCVDSHQSTAALELFNYAATILDGNNKTLSERVRLFFGMENSYGDKNTSDAMFHEGKDIDLNSLRLGDALLAAIIKSYTDLGELEKARFAFLDGTHHLDDATLMPQSTNNTLEALLDIDHDECMNFSDNMDVRYINPATFYMIARRFAQNGKWSEIGDIYNRARSAGCISEELGLIAMQAVVESELLDGKIKILRRIIIDDICGLVGMESNDWIQSRYWGIKKRVGFHYARLLMRWDNPATSQKEELLFAVSEIRRCSSEGTVPKHAPLMCIVKLAQLYDTDERVDEGMSEKQKRSAINLILEACEEARRSGLLRSHVFTSEAARSLRTLQANKECVKLVRSLIPESGKFRHKNAMEQAIHAASEERDHDSLQLLTDVFERSGYDSRNISLEAHSY